MKLELKHTVGYLPYGLKVLTNSVIREMVCEISVMETGSKRTSITNVINGVGHKLILHPLSDLTKEIEVDGEKFIPIEEYDYLRFKEISTFKEGSRYLEFIQARELELLYEMHFDIYGLIPELAIDINTISAKKE